MISRNVLTTIVRLLICLNFTTALISQPLHHISLNSEWNMMPVSLMTPTKPSDLGQNINQKGYSAQLPNSVLNVLWQNEAIEDPYLSENALHLHWLETKDWIFERYFDVDDKTLNAEKIELILRGVDTYAGVFLNDNLVFRTDNMFRTWSADVKHLIQPKNNRLRIYFMSPFNKNKDSGDNHETEEGQTLRNASIKSDDAVYEETLTTRLVTMGLESVELKAWKSIKLEEVFVKQKSLSEAIADLEVQTVVVMTEPNKISIKIHYGAMVSGFDTLLNAGEHHLNLPFTIAKPQLWWTKNLGTPFLYTIKTIVTNGVGQSDECQSRVGLRQTMLVKKQNVMDETFFLQINGVSVSDKKSSYSDIKTLNDHIKRRNWLALVESAAISNNAMVYLPAHLGILPSEDFYRLCDERGIMVWQDFVLSNTIFLNNYWVEKKLEIEANEQVRRLCKFACIAIWCGNIEPFQRVKKAIKPNNRINIAANETCYDRLFQNQLSKIVNNTTNHTVYGTYSKHHLIFAAEKEHTEGLNIKINKGIQNPSVKEKTPLKVSSIDKSKPFDNVLLSYNIEQDTFKLTFKNDRSVRALGDFLVDVYDSKGRLLFNDARMLRVEANQSLVFYRYNIKTMIQGASLSDVVVIATWKDTDNKPSEMKRTFRIEPTVVRN